MKIQFTLLDGAAPKAMEFAFNGFWGTSSIKSEGIVVKRGLMIMGGTRHYRVQVEGQQVEVSIVQPLMLAIARKRHVEVRVNGVLNGTYDMKGTPILV